MPRYETFQVLLPLPESAWRDECRGDLSRRRATATLMQPSLQSLAKRDLPAVAVSK
jgi:hypothetical protein